MKWLSLMISVPNKTTVIIVFIFLSVSPAASYDLGRTYNYEYVTDVILNEIENHLNRKNITYQVKAQVAVTTVWNDPNNNGRSLLLLQVNNPSLYVVPKSSPNGHLTKHTSNLESHFKDGNLLLYLEDDNGFRTMFADDRQPETNNFLSFKGGIASLFQFQSKEKQRLEVDSSGECTVVYETSGQVVHKFKKNCLTTLFNDQTQRRIRSNKVLGVGISSELQSTYSLNKDQVISTVETLETQKLTLNAIETIGAFIQAKQKLKLVDDEDGSKLLVKGSSLNEAVVSLSNVLKKELTPCTFHAPVSSNKNPSVDNCATLNDYVQKKQKSLKVDNLAKLSAASTFLDLVQRFRDCDKTVLTKVLKSAKNKNILPQLVDIAAATQTLAAVESVVAVVNFNAVDPTSIDLPERFLYAVATIPYPDQQIIQLFIGLVESKSKSTKIAETLLLTIGSLTKSYYELNGRDKVVDEVISLLVKKLTECKEDLCKLPFIRALRNSAVPLSIPTLIENVKRGGKSVIVESLRAIHALPVSSLNKNDQLKEVLVQVYHQLLKRQDPSSRILAAEILLVNFADVKIVESMLLAMANSSAVEVNTYVLRKMKQISLTNPEFKNLVRDAFRKPTIGNYNVLAQGGGSTTFTHLLAGDVNANATYGLRMEMLGGGLLKRSDFGIGLNHKDSSLNLFTFALYAGGLGSLAGSGTGSKDDDDDDGDNETDTEDVTAGMELNVLGVTLRPYTLFTGQGELMGHVWSGTGSETTPIFMGNFLLHDHRQSFALQNGFVLKMSILGALSLDMSGSIQSSLWNRNAHTLIQDKAAVVVQTLTRVDSSFINSYVRVNSGAEASLDFVTDIQFAEEPFKMCTQMVQPPFTIKRLVSKVENIPGSKHKLRRTRRIVNSIYGRSFALNRKNSEQCSMMLNAQ